MIEINEELARKVLQTVDAGLVRGLGEQVPGRMCVEAAVNYAMGADHSDRPSCVGAAVRAFKIRLNDAAWPTDKDRTDGMRRLAIAQLGSDQIDQTAFREYVVVETIKRILPIALRAAGSMIPAHKDALEAAATACEGVVDLSSARAAARVANEKALAARVAAYADAYAADAYAAAAAAYADAYAAADAAYAAAYAAASAAAYAAADADARLKVLLLCAEIGLEALVKLKSPGVQWLWLCDVEQ